MQYIYIYIYVYVYTYDYQLMIERVTIREGDALEKSWDSTALSSPSHVMRLEMVY